MIAEKMSRDCVSTKLDPLSLWYVPNRRLRTRSASEKAKQIVQWINTGVGLEAAPDEQDLFIALHTCAYRAARRAGVMPISDESRMCWAKRWEAVREYIVGNNLGLVYSMLGRFGRHMVDEDDLLSDAMLALTRATDRFNPWRGYRFSTYACNVIARAMMRRGKRESNYRRLFPVQHDSSFERAEGMPDSQSELYVERLKMALDRNLGDLTDVESKILAKRFPESRESRLTFQEIGTSVGLSKERVRQLQNIALTKLRAVLNEDPILQ